MDYTKEQLEELWFNAKKKKDFMEQVGILNYDTRACNRLLKKFNINQEDMGKNLINSSKKVRPNKDLIGKTFGQIKVIEVDIEKSQKHNRTYYKCYCNICKEICIKRTDCITGKDWNNGCGCKGKLTSRLKNTVDLTGQVFERLTVLGIDEEETAKHKEGVYWKCQCSCGNITSVPSMSLKWGNTKSCGCYQKDRTRQSKMVDLTGQRFGRLVVLEWNEERMKKEKAKTNYNGHAFWRCKCDCGNITIATGYDLRNGSIKSCGCLVSSGEYLLAQIFQQLNLDFKTQYTFSDLIGVNGGLLKFDFAIFKDSKLYCLVEYNGKQHYTDIEYFGGKERFKIQTEHDNRKRQYCKEHNIKLIEIPYWDFNKIDSTYVEQIIRGDLECL